MKKLLGGVLAGVVLAAGLNGGAASALASHRDNANDASADIDINKVVVSRAHKRAVVVHVTFSDFGRKMNAIQYFFDTKKSHPGPEYGAMIYRGKDDDAIKRVDIYRMRTFKLRSSHRIACLWRYHWYYNGRGPGYFHAKFPLSCFEGNGGKAIRVHVKTWNFTRYRGTGVHRHGTFGFYDNMGAPRAWTTWT